MCNLKFYFLNKFVKDFVKINDKKFLYEYIISLCIFKKLLIIKIE